MPPPRSIAAEAVSQTVTLPAGDAELCQIPLDGVADGDGGGGSWSGAVGLVQPRAATDAGDAVSDRDRLIYRDAFDLLPIGMALLDGDGRIVRANQALVELCRTSRPRADIRLIGDEFAALVAETDRPAAAARIAEAGETGHR